MLRVLIVDDDDDVRSVVSLTITVTTAHTVVGEAATTEGAVALAGRLAPDVIVTDLATSGSPEEGAAYVATLRSVAPTSRIVVFSGLTPTAERPSPPGADVHVVKGTSLAPLLAALTPHA